MKKYLIISSNSARTIVYGACRYFKGIKRFIRTIFVLIVKSLGTNTNNAYITLCECCSVFVKYQITHEIARRRNHWENKMLRISLQTTCRLLPRGTQCGYALRFAPSTVLSVLSSKHYVSKTFRGPNTPPPLHFIYRAIAPHRYGLQWGEGETVSTPSGTGDDVWH